MANSFAPFGFSQMSGNGSAPTYEQVERVIDNAAGAIYTGDPVTSQSDGTIAVSSPGTTQIAGIFVGCTYVQSGTNRTVWSPYWPGSGSAVANTLVKGYLVNDPNAQFEVQSSGAAAITLAGVGANVQFAIGTGNALTGRSGAYVTQSSLDPTTTTLPFRVVGLITSPPGANGTDITTPYNWVRVAFNSVDTRVLTGQ